MSEQEIKLRGYIIQVAIMEIPLIKLITALSIICGDQVPTEATIGALLNTYINKIDNLAERSLVDTQENYDAIYEEFVQILNKDVEPAIEAASNMQDTVETQVLLPESINSIE